MRLFIVAEYEGGYRRNEKIMSVYVVSFKDHVPYGACVINTTSRSNNWSRGLSPFFLGPVNLYKDFVAQNVENAWQFSKVYKQHVGEDNEPTEEYFEWAQKGWNDKWAHRYPMGRGAKPEYSYWDGNHLDYINARKNIYIPLYAKAVVNTPTFRHLKKLADKQDIYLQDFDAYNHKAMEWSFQDVMNCTTKKMGHAFVLAMLLEDKLNLDVD